MIDKKTQQIEKNKENISEKELLEQGYIKSRIIFEMIGKPKEHIENTLKEYIKKIKIDPDLRIIDEFYSDAEKQEDNMWSCFAEITMLIKDLQKITWLSLNFMPASIEIIEPTNFSLTNREIGLWLNDVLAKLHEINIITTGVVSKDKEISKTLGVLMKNIVLIALESGAKTTREIFLKTGIQETELKEVLKVLIKEKRVIENKGEPTTYTRIKIKK